MFTSSTYTSSSFLLHPLFRARPDAISSSSASIRLLQYVFMLKRSLLLKTVVNFHYALLSPYNALHLSLPESITQKRQHPCSLVRKERIRHERGIERERKRQLPLRTRAIGLFTITFSGHRSSSSCASHLPLPPFSRFM